MHIIAIVSCALAILQVCSAGKVYQNVQLNDCRTMKEGSCSNHVLDHLETVVLYLYCHLPWHQHHYHLYLCQDLFPCQKCCMHVLHPVCATGVAQQLKHIPPLSFLQIAQACHPRENYIHQYQVASCAKRNMCTISCHMHQHPTIGHQIPKFKIGL